MPEKKARMHRCVQADGGIKPCRRRATFREVWKVDADGNITWTYWCDEHAPTVETSPDGWPWEPHEYRELAALMKPATTWPRPADA